MREHPESGWGGAHGPSQGLRPAVAPHGMPAAPPRLSPLGPQLWPRVCTPEAGISPSFPFTPQQPTSTPKVGQPSPWTSLGRPAPGPGRGHRAPQNTPSAPLLATSSHCPSGPRDGGCHTKTNDSSGSLPSARRAREIVAVTRTRTGGRAGGGEGRSVLQTPSPAENAQLRQPPLCPPRPSQPSGLNRVFPAPAVRSDTPFSAFPRVFKEEQVSLCAARSHAGP